MFDEILKRLDILKSTQNSPMAESVPKAKITLVGTPWDTVKDIISIANPTANNQNSTANAEIYENLQYA